MRLKALTSRMRRRALALWERVLFHVLGVQVALHLEESEVRLLLMRGERALRWRSLPLPMGLLQDGVVTDPEGLASLLDLLFREEHAPRGRVLLSVGGLHAMVRTFVLPKLKGTLLGEALRRELRREVPVPLDEHHQVWQVLHTEGNQVEALILSVPNAELDSIMEAMRAARVQPTLLEWKPLAVARTVNAAEAVVVVMETASFDLIVVRDGVPTVLRTIPYPYRDMSPAQRVELVASELSLTLSYAAGEQESGEPTPPPQVYLLGKEAGDDVVRRRFQEVSGFPVDERFFTTEGFPAWEYAPNLGLVLRQQLRRGKFMGRVPCETVTLPGLLPPRWRPRLIPLRQGVYAMALAIALGAASVPVRQALGPDPQAATLEAAIARTQQQAEAARAELREANRIRRELEDLEARLQAVRQGIAEVERQDLSWPDILRAIPPDLAEAVTIASASEDARTLNLSGSAASYMDVGRLAMFLYGTGQFRMVHVPSIAPEKGPDEVERTRFSLVAEKKVEEAQPTPRP